MTFERALSDTPAKNYTLYNRLLLVVAGLGGLLYGVDVGIIGGALPYLEATAHLSNGQLSMIVAAVLLGSVLSTCFVGMIADAIGRKPVLILSGLTFILSIPIIALSQGYGPLFCGRLLQGISGGFIGVVVPLYLAECLAADVRGKGTGLFQWFLTLGIVGAAVIGMYYSYRVQAIERLGNADALFRFKDQAWRRIFWVSLPPGVLFVLGSLLVTESPRWLFSKGRLDATFQALLRSRSEQRARFEVEEMAAVTQTRAEARAGGRNDTLFRRRYILPFLIACAVLFCNTASGVNSIIGYNANILLQSGLSDLGAHWGYVVFTVLNFGMTLVGVTLVDRKGRKFLLTLGTTGMVCALLCAGLLFLRSERDNVDCRRAVQAVVSSDQTLTLVQSRGALAHFLQAAGQSSPSIDLNRASFSVTYVYGGFSGETPLYRTDEPGPHAVHITREMVLPATRFEAALRSPFSDFETARTAPLIIQRAFVRSLPDARHGWEVAACLFTFISFFALGPGVCVWLALSELMPTRIRSNGMSIALVVNQFVSTVLAAVFLPVVNRYGYSVMFFLFGLFTLAYLLVVTFALPETKGKTLEQIEAFFERRA